MGMVNLVGKKMSSRTGEIYTVDQLLEDVKSLVWTLIKEKGLSQQEKEDIAEKVTLAAVKYSMLKVNPTADIAFNLKQSVNIEGDSGPYLQYTCARCLSVLKRAKISNNNSEFKIQSLELNKEELSLLRTLVHFTEVVEETTQKYSPNLICNYLNNLAQKYNTFYSMHQIIGSKDQGIRIKLTDATGQILKNGLYLLGISSPERM